MKFKTVKFKSVNSTNNKAIKMIKSGQIIPSILIAEKQTKGKGQYGRKWISQKDNLFMSLYYEFKSRKKLKNITKENCQIIRKSLSKFFKNKIKVKPPNDLLMNQKKFCGILQEIITHKEKKYIIIGIGINLFKSPIIYNYPTTYMSKYCNKRINKSLVYNAIKKEYEKK
jgi:BirA family transcriptional regulator, biotin operon repressor / biotin---[acetyl-CoA-carboxylase] ligase